MAATVSSITDSLRVRAIMSAVRKYCDENKIPESVKQTTISFALRFRGSAGSAIAAAYNEADRLHAEWLNKAEHL